MSFAKNGGFYEINNRLFSTDIISHTDFKILQIVPRKRVKK